MQSGQCMELVTGGSDMWIFIVFVCVTVTFVLLITVPVDYLLQTKVLSADGILGVDLTYLSFILFIAVIAGIVQLVEMIVEKFSPSLYAALGIFLPLIAVNCAIMGASLFMQQRILMDPATSGCP